jgi:hypothetical protein
VAQGHGRVGAPLSFPVPSCAFTLHFSSSRSIRDAVRVRTIDHLVAVDGSLRVVWIL